MIKAVAFVFSAFLFISSGALAGAPKEIVIGMGNFEPYFTEKGNTGIFADLITAIFDHMPDHKPVFKYGFAMESAWKGYENGNIDAIANLFDTVDLGGCRTDLVFRFNDVAVSRLSDNFEIKSIQDLDQNNVVAFQGAKVFFGEDYSKAVASGDYIEVGKPALQAKMLHMNRADVSVGDLYIFLQSLRTINDVDAIPGFFKIHEIFPQILSRMGFRDEGLCEPFNAGLKKIRQSGEYEAIYDRYLDKYGYK